MNYNLNVSADNLTKIIKDGLGAKITETIVEQVYKDLMAKLEESEIKALIRSQIQTVTQRYMKASTGIYQDPATGNVIINISLTE